MQRAGNAHGSYSFLRLSAAGCDQSRPSLFLGTDPRTEGRSQQLDTVKPGDNAEFGIGQRQLLFKKGVRPGAELAD